MGRPKPARSCFSCPLTSASSKARVSTKPVQLTKPFQFDTGLTGHTTAGQDFRAGGRGNGVIGRLLQPEEGWALLEYLKVLGGPLEAQLP